MSNPTFRRDNHYLPRMYLKRWADASARVWTFRTVVSDSRVPEWKAQSVRGVAYHQYLYARVAAGGVTDELERWLASEIDSPAEAIIEKVERMDRLSQSDWWTLLDFFVASQARTPAYFLRRMAAWERELPGVIKSALERTVARLQEGAGDVPHMPDAAPDTEDEIPFVARRRETPETGGGVLEAEVLLGRTLWFREIRRLVRVTGKHLRQLHWTILLPPSGYAWLTSDDPVLCLNYNGAADFTFLGGWGTRGTELILPLSPHRLLYTRVGYRPATKYTRMPSAPAEIVQRMTVAHAHRIVFALDRVREVEQWRPRQVSSDAYEHERREWQRFHQVQSDAETAMRAGIGKRVREDAEA